MPLIVATTLAQQPSATHQGSAPTPLGPKVVDGFIILYFYYLILRENLQL
jgi:hypothetical protein